MKEDTRLLAIEGLKLLTKKEESESSDGGEENDMKKPTKSEIYSPMIQQPLKQHINTSVLLQSQDNVVKKWDITNIYERTRANNSKYVNRILKDQPLPQLSETIEEIQRNRMKDVHPYACRTRLAEETYLGSVVLDELKEYRSTFEKREDITYDKRNFSTMKLQKSIPKFDERTNLENYTEEQIKEALGPNATDKQIKKYKHGTYINCDLRYFNLASLGKFQVIYMDPPWRIGSGQRGNEKSTVVSNSNFTLHYNTMSNQEIMDMDVGILSDEGFLFLWVLNSTMEVGFEMLKKWGYKYVDKITWVKRTKKNALAMAHGYFVLHSTETCLIGFKTKYKSKFQYISRVTNDVIFAKTGMQSQKPDIMYHIIEKMVPGVRKIEIFAKNHNIHAGWLSLGNMLGPMYDATIEENYSCSECKKRIKNGTGRFKHRHLNTNYCNTCFEILGLQSLDYFHLENNAKEVVFHDWYSCDLCQQYPIRGPRFSCECGYCDICEYCYDTHFIEFQHEHPKSTDQSTFQNKLANGQINISNEIRDDDIEDEDIDDEFKDFLPLLNSIPIKENEENDGENGDHHEGDILKYHRHHSWTLHEVPVIGNGFPVHYRVRCNGCLAIPIIGERFRCDDCSINLCRNCFFLEKEPKHHDKEHRMSLIPEARRNTEKLSCYNCHCCPVITARKHAPLYRCNTCIDIILCRACYHHRHSLKCFKSYLTHKPFHEFSRV